MNNTSVAESRGDSNSARQSNGARGGPVEVEVTAFKAYSKNTLQGFCDLLLPAVGLKILGATLAREERRAVDRAAGAAVPGWRRAEVGADSGLRGQGGEDRFSEGGDCGGGSIPVPGRWTLMGSAAVRNTSCEFCLPDSLTELVRWVLWRTVIINGRPTKIPYQVNGKQADTTDPVTWNTFEAVVKQWRRFPKHYDGVGFVFVKTDGITGIDLDDCLDASGELKPWAQGVIERFSDSYMEVSPSGTGVKIWVYGAIPENLPGVKVGDGQIEMYDHGRYFTTNPPDQTMRLHPPGQLRHFSTNLLPGCPAVCIVVTPVPRTSN